MESKQCNECLLTKPLDQFRRYRRRCRQCNDRIEAERRRSKCSTDPAEVAKLTKSHKRYVRTTRGQASVKLTCVRRRAQSRAIPFDLDVEWLMERLSRGKCEMTDIPFDNTDFNLMASVDRIDPNGGYLKTNCRLVLNCVNAFKGTMTDSELKLIAEALINYGSNL
jgi:hypothetical protein